MRFTTLFLSPPLGGWWDGKSEFIEVLFNKKFNKTFL
jgi:hypothetical protein